MKLHRLMACEASPADVNVKPGLLRETRIGLEMMNELLEANTNTWRMVEPRAGWDSVSDDVAESWF